MTQKDKEQLYILLTKSIEGDISPEQFSLIRQLLASSPESMKYYVDYISMIGDFRSFNGLVDKEEASETEHDNSALDMHFWHVLSEEERVAPAIAIPKEKSQRKLIQKVVYPLKEKRKMSKFQIVTLAMSAAAMFFFVLFLKFAPQNHGVEVATLVDQMNVQWGDSKVDFKNGARLWTNQEPIDLNKGIVKLQYDDGVDVLIEGPAKFAVERSGVYIEYGRLFSRVSESGLGFVVETPTVRFIDQGTEFGVQADVDGSAELHVIKGKVQLFVEASRDSKASRVITGNEAVRYLAGKLKMENVPIKKTAFVRSINSTSNFLWRGQQTLNLADMVGGGNGFGSGAPNSGIDFASGNIQRVESEFGSYRQSYYSPVKNHPYIDGVFIPHSGTVQIASTGLMYDQFPNTLGECYAPICNNKSIRMGYDENAAQVPLLLGNAPRSNPADPRIVLHADAGITFDLAAIRETLAGFYIRRFQSDFGLIESESTETDVDLFILVDGKEVFSKKGYLWSDSPLAIDIELNQSDRFLTIVCMEGVENRGDWPIFVNPILSLEAAE